MNSNGILKIADFGLAKFYGSPNRQYTHMVVTRWYRAPELLFGARNYGTGVDVWAVGCILAELLLRIPFVAGDTDLDQLGKIFQVYNSQYGHSQSEKKFVTNTTAASKYIPRRPRISIN